MIGRHYDQANRSAQGIVIENLRITHPELHGGKIPGSFPKIL
jgi:hypothetical protein